MSAQHKILYIEDDPTNKALVRKLLSAAGYLVVEAEDGVSGIEAARRERPDLILMDMQMPGLDGYEATTRIKGMREFADTPIIAVTANAMKGDRERSLTAGCNGYIAKPIDIDHFVAQVESYRQGKQERVDAEDQTEYLKAYSHKLVGRLEEKVRELEAINSELEARVSEKVAELKAAQDQLLQSEKMASVGQLAAGVAHEINNPVGYIDSNLGTLQRYLQSMLGMLEAYEAAEDLLPEDAEARERINALKTELDLGYLREDVVELVKESREGLNRVKQIVQNLKEFSHKGEQEWKSEDLHSGIDSTLDIVYNDIKYTADVTKEYGELPHIECILPQLNQVFMNLLINAAHAIESRGIISIRTGTKDDWAWVEISDTGKGIDPEHLTRIFDPFFTTMPIGKGTGLGLSLSYTIIENHGGRIDVESELGQGTTFRLWLPLVQPNMHAQAAGGN